jgi:RimJ/RimL family protein N-acetyltransferase
MPEHADHQVTLTEIVPERDGEDVAVFLSSHTWPFHSGSALTLERAREIRLGPRSDVRAFWIKEGNDVVGIVRAFDLEDADDGSVAFDLRISAARRGHGVGRQSVGLLVALLFTEYPELHRIEATTRFDNRPMRRVLEVNKFLLEGCLRETWPTESGVRYDTALYGLLRRDA